MKFPKFKLATATASLFLAAFLTTGCHIQSFHPNQINTFDGSVYDTMTLAHGALTSLRVSISTQFPQYVPEFNKAVEAYNAAVVIYSTYRSSTGTESELSTALSSLTEGVVTLESTILSDLHVDTRHTAVVRKNAQAFRERASLSGVIADILTQLEIAASLASVAPSTESYASLAKAIISATQNAIMVEQATANKPIQLETIAAIMPISQ